MMRHAESLTKNKPPLMEGAGPTGAHGCSMAGEGRQGKSRSQEGHVVA